MKTFTFCVLSSVLYIFAFPNFNQAWVAWVALIPLATISFTESPQQAFKAGWAAGTLAYCGILYWIVVTFQAAHLSILLACLCLFLLAAYLGLYWGAWAWFISCLYHGFWPAQTDQPAASFGLPKRSNVVILGGAAAWVALEYLRTYLFSGFPWALLGDSQVKLLPIIQIASITGVYGVSFLIVLVSLTIAFFARHTRIPLLGMTILIILLAYGFGLHRLYTPLNQDSQKPLRIALLQGNIDQYKKWDKTYVSEIQGTYESLVMQAVREKPDLIVWPETSVPGYLLQDAPLRDWLLALIRKSETGHLIGAPVIHGEMSYNASFSINSKSILEGEYAKTHLVPFGETVPWGSILGRFIKVLNDLGGFTAGTYSPVLNVSGTPVGINICYEAIFPNLVRQSVRQGAQIIANLTNDGWYMRTAAPYQHWAPNIFRAVENDRWLVRADNTGISGIIDPQGHIQIASSIFETLVVQGTVIPRTHLTFYTRYGDVFAQACAMLVLVLLIYSRL